MSRFLGVARMGCNGTPLIDVLYDTTVADEHATAFCHVVDDPKTGALAADLSSRDEPDCDFGVAITL
jgi:hypothetical protein